MNLIALAANGAWFASCAPGFAKFSRALHDVAHVQTRILTDILSANAHTRFGRHHGFSSVRTIEDFRSRVPLQTYEDAKPCIDAAARGEPDVLTRGVPERFLPTSGSASASKRIPFTADLRRQFHAAIAPWVFDLFRRHPQAMGGRAYWSISPGIPCGRTEGGLPVGFEDDLAYLGPVAQRLLRPILAVPPAAVSCAEHESFLRETLLHLLLARDLRLISVWSPTYLILLFEPLRRLAPQLLPLLPGPRAHEVRAALAESTTDDELLRRLWPRLSVVSCWTSGSAEGPARELRKRLPHVHLEPKGLVATEGIVSIPLGGGGAMALAVRSHFFEFIPESEPDRVLTAWEIQRGQSYGVVLTTGGGLYRYRLEDLIRVTGHFEQCPLIEFVGKTDKISDLCGEKLHEQHARQAIAEALAGWPQKPSFTLLAPEGGDGYTLFLAGEVTPAAELIAECAQRLEGELAANVHYAYCRRLGQLRPAAVCWVDGGSAQATRRFHEVHRTTQREGDIKPPCLDHRCDWRHRLLG